MTIVFKISDNLKNMVIKYYEKYIPLKTPPYAVFQVKNYDTTITLYESGKLMFQGLSADIEASLWIEQERIKNHRYIDISGKIKKLIIAKANIPLIVNITAWLQLVVMRLELVTTLVLLL